MVVLMTAKCADEKNYDLKGAYIIKELNTFRICQTIIYV